MVVHNPESNMGNACGCPPTMHIVHKGILTGLGTDGYTHDMTGILLRWQMCSTNTISAMQTQRGERFRRCCLRGTQDCKPLFQTGTGRIERRRGRRCDHRGLQSIDTASCRKYQQSYCIWYDRKRRCDNCCANGKVLMKDRELP